MSSTLKFNLPEIWRWLILFALPINQVAAIRAGGTTFNLSEFLAPLMYVTLLLLLLRDSFPVPRYLVFAFLLLAATIVFESIILVFVHDNSPVYALKMAIGQTFIFFTYMMFGRARSDQSRRHLLALCWIGGVVSIASILLSGSLTGRLDSILWGRSNLFGATLLPTLAAGIIGLLLYRKWSLLFPVMASLAAIVLTQSRGSLVLALAVIVLLIVVAGRRPLRTIFWLALAGVFAVGLSFVIPRQVLEAVPVVERFVQERENLTQYLESRDAASMRLVMSGRLVVWSNAIQWIESEPWVGIDELYELPQSWATSLETPGVEMTFHSWFLNIGATRGLVVLALNILIAFVMLRPFWRRRAGRPQRLVGVALLILLIYGLAEPLFDGGLLQLNMITLLFWILAGIGINLPVGGSHARSLPVDFQSSAPVVHAGT